MGYFDPYRIEPRTRVSSVDGAPRRLVDLSTATGLQPFRLPLMPHTVAMAFASKLIGALPAVGRARTSTVVRVG